MGKENMTQFPVRCTAEMRAQAEESAAAAGQSLVEWVRRAMQEKLEREKKYTITDEFRMAVRDVIEEYNAEKKEG